MESRPPHQQLDRLAAQDDPIVGTSVANAAANILSKRRKEKRHSYNSDGNMNSRSSADESESEKNYGARNSVQILINDDGKFERFFQPYVICFLGKWNWNYHSVVKASINVFTDHINHQFNIDAEVTNYFSNGDDKYGCLKRGNELKDFVKTDG